MFETLHLVTYLRRFISSRGFGKLLPVWTCTFSLTAWSSRDLEATRERVGLSNTFGDEA